MEKRILPRGIKSPQPVTSGAVSSAIVSASTNINESIIDTIGSLNSTKYVINDNLNHCVNPGVYIFSPLSANAPFSAYGVVLVLGNRTIPSSSNQWIFQLAILADNTNRICLRETINPNSLTPSTWTAWKEL